jgi:hypothetical protein
LLDIPLSPKILEKTVSATDLSVIKEDRNENQKSIFESILNPLIRFENSSLKKKGMDNWDFLRSQLIEAKIRDAFGTYKFYVNGQCLRVLRLLGQGGSAQVRNPVKNITDKLS